MRMMDHSMIYFAHPGAIFQIEAMKCGTNVGLNKLLNIFSVFYRNCDNFFSDFLKHFSITMTS